MGGRTDGSGAGTGRRSRPPRMIVEQLEDLWSGVAAVVPDVAPLAARLDYAGCRRALADLWDLVLTALTTGAADPPTVVAARAQLLTRVRDLQAELEDARSEAVRVQMLTGVADAVSELRRCSTAADLFDCAALVGNECLGFDRTLVSSVEDDTWQMRAMHVPADPAWARDIVAVGTSAPPRLDGALVESDVVDTGLPVLVMEVPDNPRVFRQLAVVGKSSSYAAAPVVLRGSVVGMIHADQYFQRRDMRPDDRAVLVAFAAGFGRVLDHLHLSDGLAALQAGMPIRTAASARRIEPARGLGDVLSRRENEVMQLLAEGEANRQIAARMHLSETTVKTHVASILRKLRVRSRAEAVAVWLKATAASV
ncbi:MAG: LuxR C-terminal-related transcriptional regulator [Rhodococcus sp. (in: high G+C Gram-positive bacteria)]